MSHETAEEPGQLCIDPTSGVVTRCPVRADEKQRTASKFNMNVYNTDVTINSYNALKDGFPAYIGLDVNLSGLMLKSSLDQTTTWQLIPQGPIEQGWFALYNAAGAETSQFAATGSFQKVWLADDGNKSTWNMGCIEIGNDGTDCLCVIYLSITAQGEVGGYCCIDAERCGTNAGTNIVCWEEGNPTGDNQKWIISPVVPTS
jgi:hypothetical protein